jgi:stage V sporulation protein G
MESSGSVPGLAARVKVFRDDSGKATLLGFADLTIAEAFVIKGIRILATKEDGGEGRPFVSFPCRKGPQDKYFDVAHPITAAARQRALDVILASYGEAAGPAG